MEKSKVGQIKKASKLEKNLVYKNSIVSCPNKKS